MPSTDTAALVERSRSSERIDFAAIRCLRSDDPLVPVRPTDRLGVEPIWTVDGDAEGRLYADYIAAHPEYTDVYLRSEVLARLLTAAGLLPPGRRLVIRAGHRPLEVQTRVLHQCAADYRASHPGCSDDEALAHARMYVSDPAVKRPPHCCGAAVDVDVLVRASGEFVDFGGPMNADSEISHLHSDAVSGGQHDARMELLEVMLRAGFASYYAEWWHFSYGDDIWAWFHGEAASLYDLVEWPPATARPRR